VQLLIAQMQARDDEALIDRRAVLTKLAANMIDLNGDDVDVAILINVKRYDRRLFR
jgi:hypothetical protein